MHSIEILRRNVARISEQVEEAREQAVRMGSASPNQSIRIVAVSKYVDAQWTRQLVEAGCHELGESRPQVLWQKFDALADLTLPQSTDSNSSVRWHMIGHLQRNKVARTLPMIELLHSLDSLRLAETIHIEALKQGRVCRVLVEVNPTEDRTKTGLQSDEVPALLRKLCDMQGIQVCGLMAMSSLEATPEQSLVEFQQVRLWRDQWAKEFAGEIDLSILSMGMSGDFRQAILAGATMVRIGSLYWEGV